MKKFVFALSALGFLSQQAPSRAASGTTSNWVSLYSGKEADFSTHDRQQVLAALRALGIEHKELSDLRILVSPDNRALAQDLVAKVFSQQTVSP